MTVRKLMQAIGATVVVLALTAGTATAKDWTRLRLGTSADDPPNTSVRPDGTLEGLEIDLAADICKRMKVECEWVQQDFPSLMRALPQGQIDVLFAVLAITPKRREIIDFSIPFVGNRQGVLVRKSSPLSTITTGAADVVSLDDTVSAQPVIDTLARAMQGKVIGTDAGGARVELAERYFKANELRTYPTSNDVMRELLAGHIDAALGRHSDLDAPDRSELQRIGPWFANGVFGPGAGIGLRKTDPELKAKIDEAIKAALADGTIERLYIKYYHSFTPPM